MEKQKTIKVLLTGGHAATVALATVEELSKRHRQWRLYWIGPSSAMEGASVATAAEKTLGQYNVQTLKIIAGRLKKRGRIWDRFMAYVKIPIGFVHALVQVVRVRPNLVVSFGGFAALPVVVASWLTGRPVIIHEQIVGAGLANRLSAIFADKIAVARHESLEVFPKGKTVQVGNPQVSKIFKIKPKEKLAEPPTIYITGGSSGSQIINEAVDSILDRLVDSYVVIHQTGEANLEYFKHRKSKLGSFSDRYECFGYLPPDKIASVFEKADIVVSRAGANTVSDIVAARRPAIIIPIPWSIADEQRKNAQKASQTGLAVVLEQDQLSGESLFDQLKYVKDNWVKMTKEVKKSDFDLDVTAAGRFADLIEENVR